MTAIRRRLILICVLVVAAIASAAAQTENVYVTRTGEKYHRETCRSLAKSKIEMPLAEAAARYGACKNCKPPIPTAAPAATNAGTAAAVERPRPAATSGRCQATTKKGTQCSRTVKAGSSYCWQHGG